MIDPIFGGTFWHLQNPDRSWEKWLICGWWSIIRPLFFWGGVHVILFGLLGISSSSLNWWKPRIRSNASCSGITLVQHKVTSSETTCCPMDSLSCGGCMKYASGQCAKCVGGFLLKDGKCTACISTVGWTNELGDTCDAIPAADCNDRPVNGLSSNQACCQCNGGEKSATPFTYPDTRFAVGAAVSLKPLPRTAERYSVDSGCGFAAHNLTIDGATGAITSTQNPTKPFTVQCEVSAHQALHLVSTVKVSVTVEFMSYGAGALIFSSGVTSYPVALGSPAADWTDFGMVCAPEAPWLSIASSGAVLHFIKHFRWCCDGHGDAWWRLCGHWWIRLCGLSQATGWRWISKTKHHLCSVEAKTVANT